MIERGFFPIKNMNMFLQRPINLLFNVWGCFLCSEGRLPDGQTWHFPALSLEATAAKDNDSNMRYRPSMMPKHDAKARSKTDFRKYFFSLFLMYSFNFGGPLLVCNHCSAVPASEINMEIKIWRAIYTHKSHTACSSQYC